MNHRPFLLKRDPEGNKGTFGRVLVIAGNRNMSGCVFFSCMGALRSGAGLVNVFTEESNILPLKIQIPEAIFDSFKNSDLKNINNSESEINHNLLILLDKADSVVIGPGLGVNDDVYNLVKFVIDNFQKNIVIDADALNSISLRHTIKNIMNEDFVPEKDNPLFNTKDRKIIITPHILELSRLLKITNIEYLKENVEPLALEIAKEFNIITVLKDPKTKVSDGSEVYSNTTGNSALATAGAGDILAGMIGAIINNDDYTFRAVNTAVYLHGKAGEKAGYDKTEYSCISSDILNFIPEAFKDLSKGDRYLGNAVIYEVLNGHNQF